MRNRSFRPWLWCAVLLEVGLCALLSVSAAPRFALAATTATASDPSAAVVALSPTVAPGDVPAFAGRVDLDTYRVGPGDEFTFRSSDLLDPKVLRIGPTGEITLPDAGSIAVAGQTLREMVMHAREILRPYIRGRGFVLTLARPRRFRAVVVGDVVRPGAVLVQAPARASDAIEAAGGVGPKGARRGIAVLRGADTVWVDLIRFERTGNLDVDPLVFETDVILVPPSVRHVEIMGAVAHPGWYDLAPGDRASTLIAVAGGLLARAASDRIMLSRQSDPGHREEFAVAARSTGSEIGNDSSDPALTAGDRLLVPEHAHWQEGARAEIRGEVLLPGPYGIVDGLDRLGSLLTRAGGFTEWADSMAIRIERNSDSAVRDSAFFRLVREQDALVPESERDYVIARSRERAAFSLSPDGWGRSGHSRGAWKDIPLLNGDRIIVPRASRTVMVQGEVKAPGHVPFEPGQDVGDYVRAAGGYTGRANQGRTRVTLASTGRPVDAGDVPDLHGGDIIWVPARAPRSLWGVAREILTTTAQAATIYLVVREATR